MSEKTLIYVSISSFDHPNTTFWEPVQSIHEHGDCYRILEKNSDPEHVYWQFSADDVVHCVENKFAEGEFGLIAVDKCTH